MGAFGRSFTAAFIPSFQQGQQLAANAIAADKAKEQQLAAEDRAFARQKELIDYRAKASGQQQAVAPIDDLTSTLFYGQRYNQLDTNEKKNMVGKMGGMTSTLERLWPSYVKGEKAVLGIEALSGDEISYTFDKGRSFLDNFRKLAAIGQSRRFQHDQFLINGQPLPVGEGGKGWLNESIPSGVTYDQVEAMVGRYEEFMMRRSSSEEKVAKVLPPDRDQSIPTKRSEAGQQDKTFIERWMSTLFRPSGQPAAASEAPVTGKNFVNSWANVVNEVSGGYLNPEQSPPLRTQDASTTTPAAGTLASMRTNRVPQRIPDLKDFNDKLGEFPNWGIQGSRLAGQKAAALKTAVAQLVSELSKGNPLEVAKKFGKKAMNEFPLTLGPYFKDLDDTQLMKRIAYLIGRKKGSKSRFPTL